MITAIQYVLFCKINRTHIIQNTNSYIQQTKELSVKEKENLALFIEDFLKFISKQIDVKNTNDLSTQLHLFIQVYTHEISGMFLSHFRSIIEQAMIRLLFNQRHPQTEQIFIFQSRLITNLTNQYFASIDQINSLSNQNSIYLEKLDKLSEILISSSGSEEIPIIINEMKEIFAFKRCNFYAYNAWSNEFYGIYGDDLELVQRIKGKLTAEHPVFNLKIPLYLQDPSSYVVDVVIQYFNLSSIIFIPVIYREQLFGWLSFDQKGESFEYSKPLLDTLEIAGIRLGMFLARKPSTYRIDNEVSITEKEKSILYLISEGYSNKEIASLLFLSEYTIRDYVQNLLTKLNARNRTHMVANAYKMGYIS
ncbi:LuxR C-terminal-related transcriptional regulator [Lysinibacillus sp. SGAir0095]|uniref:LuxR C-terminal-related transcriptional regulator n=1 Tax=Lysinibacillus sp. SGAir0095 TaxID=2070463 RepID=UPI00143D0A06|nr:LuxR C-terminal-related transcriptional regulator [Lysinibacillus sp. SGAir0095]